MNGRKLRRNWPQRSRSGASEFEAKAKPFEPGATLDTGRVWAALAKLKAEHFPELEVDVFSNARRQFQGGLRRECLLTARADSL